MRYDIQLGRHVPGTLGELRTYFEDADAGSLGGEAGKSHVLEVMGQLIDTAPDGHDAKPSVPHTEMVRMVFTQARQLAVSVLDDLEVLVEGAKMTGKPEKMVAVAARIEHAVRDPRVSTGVAMRARKLALGLRERAEKT